MISHTSADATGVSDERPERPALPDPDPTPLRVPAEAQMSMHTRQAFKLKVRDLVYGDRDTQRAPRPNIVIDATECGYLDSSALGVLVSLNKTCKDAGGSLVITHLGPEQRAYLAITKMDTVLTLDPPIADAERVYT